ncbi:MAG: phosphoglucosamine mutase [Planctomycetota bacterium]
MSDAPSNIFGTDGIRDLCAPDGRSDGWLNPAGLDRLAVGMARLLGRARDAGGIAASPPRVLIGRDPRTSGPAIERSLTASLERRGIAVRHGGLLPTPAVSVLVEAGEAELGIVISASHNPPEFNGVKWFGPDGAKLSEEEERRITCDVLAAPVDPEVDPGPSTLPAPAAPEEEALRSLYLDRLLAGFGEARPLDGLRIVLDCARGATAPGAREAFERAGASVVVIHGEPDGERINIDCGSTHPGSLARRVVAEGADLGVAFDGDGDRAILVDEAGGTVDGDEMLAIWALDLRARGRLPGDRIAVTVMSNAGMESHLRERGVDLVRTPVGDREVHEAMRAGGLALGGEQSGHIICEDAMTGDGIRTGLALAEIVRRSGRPLSALRSEIPRYPQTLVGVQVGAKPPLEILPGVQRVVAAAKKALEGHGRILLRYSGTEPLARVLVEGRDAEENADWAERIADSLRTDRALASPGEPQGEPRD